MKGYKEKAHVFGPWLRVVGPAAMTFAAMVIALVASSGCLGGESFLPLGSRCERDSECNAPMICQYGRCRSPCTFDFDCIEGLCMPSEDDPGVWVCTVPGENCDDEYLECPGDTECNPIDEYCRARCEEHDDCEGIQICFMDYCFEYTDEFCGDDDCTPPMEDAEICPLDCAAVCGDDLCTHGETAATCGVDCDPRCGDGFCTHDETHEECPGDCPPFCGNNSCEPELDENVQTCPADCPVECGDGVCTGPVENPDECWQDCDPVCNDGWCTHEENASTCHQDCDRECGDGFCTHDEDPIECDRDCLCGDERCQLPENAYECPEDCDAVDGDGFCTHDENAFENPTDCDEVLQVDTGGSHTCARMEGDTIRCWGLGSHGQLGYGSLSNIGDADDNLPYMAGDVGLSLEVIEISGGQFHTCVVLSDNTARCWGANESGQLGTGDLTRWGGPGWLPLGLGPIAASAPVQHIAAGSNFTCALIDGGLVECWGEFENGKLGDDHTDNQTSPQPVIGLPDPVSNGVVEISTGTEHACARIQDLDGDGARLREDSERRGVVLGPRG